MIVQHRSGRSSGQKLHRHHEPAVAARGLPLHDDERTFSFVCAGTIGQFAEEGGRHGFGRFRHFLLLIFFSNTIHSLPDNKKKKYQKKNLEEK
jgi:hypothetical protein